ncbi:MAG: hypothetical protein AC479_00880 [miscellaneous Crenarchaeota group-6 archaeon AD8-1]|nr:MAG: hypothetical protein AC479_00880 [miscellaneous Crenarchaeota group-6 archaeon AD8-1]
MISDLIYALIGFGIMFAVLIGIGINEPRGTSIKTWCYGYLAIAIVFDLLVIFALISGYSQLTGFLLGSSAGAATGLGIHVAHHISEENHDEKIENSKKKKTIFGL